MARITLNEKLKKEKDYEKIILKIKNMPKPLPYIMRQYAVTYITAKKFLDEINGQVRIKVKTIKSNAPSSKSVFIAESFVIQVKDKFGPENSHKLDIRDLLTIGNQIEKFKEPVLIEIFRILTGRMPRTGFKFRLIKAVKWLVQDIYYTNIKGFYPLKMKQTLDLAVKDCLSD